MSLTPEQIAELRGQAGLSPTPPPEGVNNDAIIAQRKARLGVVEEPQPMLYDKAIQGINKVASPVAGFTGGKQLAQGLGQTIANAGGAQNANIEALDQSMKLQSTLLKQIKENKASGKDTTRLESALTELSRHISESGGEMGDLGTGGLSNKEVIGSAIQLGANAIPLGKVEGIVGKGLEKVVPAVAEKAIPLASKGIVGAAQGYAADVGTQLQDAEKTTGEAFKPGFGTVVGGTIPFVSALTGALAKHVSGFTSGTGSDVIERAVQNPKAVEEAVTKYAKTPEAKQSLVDRARSAITDFMHGRSEEYGASLNALKSAEPLTKDAVEGSFSSNIGRFGGTLSDKGAISFKNTTLTKGDQDAIKEVWSAIKGWDDTSPKGMDALRQTIRNHMDDFSLAGNDRANVVLSSVEKDLNNYLSKNLTGYSKMLGQYSSKSKIIKDVVKELGIGGAAKPSTQLNNVMRIFQKDPSLQNKLVEVMGKEGAEQFFNDISGAILSDWLPQGGKYSSLGRAATEAGAAGTAAFLGGAGAATIPAVIGGATLASPRIVGKAATTVGKLGEKGVGEVIRKTATMGAAKQD